jgi:hypothetical protein
MMAQLFSKDEDLCKSAPAIGADILRLIEESGKTQISIFDVTNKLSEKYTLSVRNVYYGMLFLYSLDIIEFEAPYLITKC